MLIFDLLVELDERDRKNKAMIELMVQVILGKIHLNLVYYQAILLFILMMLLLIQYIT